MTAALIALGVADVAAIATLAVLVRLRLRNAPRRKRSTF